MIPSRIGSDVEAFRTPNDRTVRLAIRPGTSDGPIAYGVVTEDEYRLRGRSFAGVLLDVGAHIGSVGLALAVENPDLSVIAVEALPENVEMIRRNVALNGLDDRFIVLSAAGGDGEKKTITYGYLHVDGEPDDYVRDGRFVGNMYAAGDHPEMAASVCEVDGISLDALVELAGGFVRLLKLDCEGCEWEMLRSPAVAACTMILGEWHGDPGLPGLHELLDPTHSVEQLDENPVNGIFRAVRR